jgi:hypothetical protein
MVLDVVVSTGMPYEKGIWVETQPADEFVASTAVWAEFRKIKPVGNDHLLSSIEAKLMVLLEAGLGIEDDP